MRTKTCSTLLLLLGLVLPVLSNKCPDPGRLPPTCECEENDEDFLDNEIDIELSCSSSTLTEVKDALRLLDRDSRLEVSLDDMDLQTLPSEVFYGWNVVKLVISHCELDSLAPEGQKALAGLEDKLEILEITASFNEQNQETKIDLSHLLSLTELDLSYNVISEIGDDWFANGPTSLTTLILSNNGIDELGDEAFAKLVNLESLELHGNRFGDIKRSMLPTPANKLEKLELDNNGLTDLPQDLFTDMKDLKVLALTNNGIRSVGERVFKQIWPQLEILDVRGNPIECDSSMEWLFEAGNEAVIFGNCEGPPGRKGMDLHRFIENRGQ